MSTTTMTSTAVPPPVLQQPPALPPAVVASITTINTTPVVQAQTETEFQSWSELTRDEQLACIGANPSNTKYGGMTAWPAIGCLLKKWHDTILKLVQSILNHEENQRELRGRRPRTKKYLPSPLLCMLSLAGSREMAVPYIVLLYRELDIARNAVKLLQDDRVIARYDFSFLAQQKRIQVSAAENDAVQPFKTTTERTDMSLCGRAIRVLSIPLDHGAEGRLATIGGVLKLAPYSYYALTSAHVFFDTGDEGRTVDGETDADSDTNDDNDISSTYADSDDSDVEPSVPTAPEAHAVFLRTDFPINSIQQMTSHTDQSFLAARHVGNAFTNRSGIEFPILIYNPKLDWALVELTDPRFWNDENHVQISDGVIQPHFGSSHEPLPETELLILTEFPELSVGRSIGAKSAIELPWRTNLVEAWVIECKTELGACGSWVVERRTGVVVGIVVAHSPDSALTWMLPAGEIFDDIQRRWQPFNLSREDVPHKHPIQHPLRPSNLNILQAHSRRLFPPNDTASISDLAETDVFSAGASEVLSSTTVDSLVFRHKGGPKRWTPLTLSTVTSGLPRALSGADEDNDTGARVSELGDHERRMAKGMMPIPGDWPLSSVTSPELRKGIGMVSLRSDDTGGLSLDAGFGTRSSRFFSIGRVFIMLGHENDTRAAASTRDPQRLFGERVWSEVRRFAVVRERHGFSWVVPINTYGGKGVGKQGFNEADWEAHAIIHMDKTEPRTLPDEPPMSKTPIVVDRSGGDKKLHEASRIRFDKVFSVEHNVKVVNVGKITQASMPYFRHYWRTEASNAAAFGAPASRSSRR